MLTLEQAAHCLEAMLTACLHNLLQALQLQSGCIAQAVEPQQQQRDLHVSANAWGVLRQLQC